MDIRDLLTDGIDQLATWTDEALDGLTADQVNWLPPGRALSIGFQAWHISRTADNITNFAFQRAQPIWLEQGYMERFDLPRVAQGTGMEFEDARGITINDPALLREYAAASFRSAVEFIGRAPDEFFAETQTVKPWGDKPKWWVCRQVIMDHGFMHLGEINALRGMQGLAFSM